MRYSRMRETTPPEEKSGKPMGLIVFLLIAGAVVYLVSAGKAGNFLSEKVIQPIANYFSEDTPRDEADAQGSSGTSAQTASITFPSIELYLLQVGVYSEEENAKKAATEIAAIGGAGYFYEDEGNYRVLISGYSAKSDAEDVHDRLEQEQQMESKLLTLLTEETVYTLTTEPEVITLFEKFPEESAGVHRQLMELSLELDKGNISKDTALATLGSIRETTLSYLTQFRELVDQSEDALLTRTAAYCETLLTACELSEELSEIEVSAGIKRAYIAAAYAYRDLVEGE